MEPLPLVYAKEKSLSLVELTIIYNYSKIFKTFNKDIILQCQYFSGFWLIDLYYDFHRFNFLDTLLRKGAICRNRDIDEHDCLEWQSLCSKYGITSDDSVKRIKYKLWHSLETRIQMLQV